MAMMQGDQQRVQHELSWLIHDVLSKVKGGAKTPYEGRQIFNNLRMYADSRGLNFDEEVRRAMSASPSTFFPQRLQGAPGMLPKNIDPNQIVPSWQMNQWRQPYYDWMEGTSQSFESNPSYQRYQQPVNRYTY